MILIADSGSTKTAWWMGNFNGNFNDNGNEKVNFYDNERSGGAGDDRPTGTYIQTQGINPFQQTEEEVCGVLSHELMPKITETLGSGPNISAIYFYGAGCTKEKAPIVASALRKVVSADARISVESDMLGAARGLCGDKPGIVGILGTGSNSCLYDGHDIVANVSPLGYILGDEGSGAYIGKRLVGDVLKKQLPDDVCRMFSEETHEDAASIIQKVYRTPLPNRFLASLSPFCARHRDIPAIKSLLIDCFVQYFRRNIDNYNTEGDRAVHLVGSIAYYYKNEIAEAANQCGYSLGNVLQAPLEGLVKYHNSSFACL